ncbi:Ribonuclease III [hydrothermal vent metagenome]|uniref:ribonuclease III n=1 Tax=hydrothermal vent metagenome TaxID=652676 RepID=A0A3B0THU5_9ZZZZ
MADNSSSSKLEKRLGYVFSDKELLKRALTHSSAISPGKRIEHSYQRLEFLGDRVLGLVVADLLFKRTPQANEGELSRTLNSVVRKESCAQVARALDLGAAIYLGTSEARTGGAEKEAILGDVCEAIIGAIYCDGGLASAYTFIENAFASHLSNSDAHRADAKTSLQEWAQGRKLLPPTYREISRTGPDHAPLFSIAVSVEGFAEAEAEGPSKKIAEHKAASNFLKREKIWNQDQ